MEKKQARRAKILEALAAQVLEKGLADTSLRRLAAGAGTSDRMLLYYFKDKDDLIASILTKIGDDLGETLGASFGGTRRPPADVLTLLWSTMKSAQVANQLKLWLELSSRASRGDPFFADVVAQIAEGWIGVISGLLDAPPRERRALAVLIMAALDGQAVLFPTDLSKGDRAMARLAALMRRTAAA